MIVEDQQETIEFLSRSETFATTESVRRVETHISEIFLAGDRALKLKRAVRYPYLDFSTVALRGAACRAEVAVNSRTAPQIYRGVVPVTRDLGGHLHLGGDGNIVDWLVDMARFDDSLLFDRLAVAGQLDATIMEDTAAAIATFHKSCQKTAEFGGYRGMADNIDVYAEAFAGAPSGTFDAADIERLIAGSRRVLETLTPLLERRRTGGHVRHGHGDLHLRNIVRIDGAPVLFDAIEFSDAIANIDVLFDLAFLLMDLEHRNHAELANIVFNRYLDITAEDAGEAAGLAALPLFLSQRAAIRAHVTGAAAASGTGGNGAGGIEEARDYLRRAVSYLAPPPPLLVAIGGLSGAGKSTLARALAADIGAAPGARIARSDVLRKRLAGVDAFERLGSSGYTRSMTERTFAAVNDTARVALAAGHAVIADAVFGNLAQRTAIEDVARAAGVRFIGLWLDVPKSVRLERGTARGRDASDAGAAIIAAMSDAGIGDVGWHRLGGAVSIEDTAAAARGLIASAH